MVEVEYSSLPEEVKAEMRQTQLGVLDSRLKGFTVAYAGNDQAKYGEVGRKATHDVSYKQAMSNPDDYVGRLMASVFEAAENESGELYGGAVSPGQLIKKGYQDYFSSINYIKVSDVLERLGIEKVHEGHISSEQKDMYMADFKEANEKIYKSLVGAFQTLIERTGVGNDIAESGKAVVSGLERTLQTSPEVIEEILRNRNNS